jgi:2-polyprenyl-6-methoxyphenol hydroxylase-like FAD-dependent oxidoreductase
MSHTALPARTHVAIVGAGPTGLTLAISLASAGIDFVVVDKLAQGSNTSRAAVVHARTLRSSRSWGRRRTWSIVG